MHGAKVETQGRCLARRETGKEQGIKVPHSKDLASHTVPESCVAYCEVRREALTGGRIGQPLSRESPIQGADAVKQAEGNTARNAVTSSAPARRGPRAWHVRTFLVWEPGDLWPDHRCLHPAVTRIGNARSRS